MNKRWRLLAALGLLAAVLGLLTAGCGDRTEKVYTSRQDMENFANKLMLLNVYEEKGLVHMSSGSTEESVYLQVRKKDDFVKPVMEPEIREIKEAIFEEIGYRVPLELQVYTIDEVPHITGKLTAVEGDRVLIVSGDEYIGDEQRMPQAIWFDMAEDAVILNNGSRTGLEELRIGYEVRGWHSGMVMESYPEQTEGLKIVVAGTGTAETGELTGTLEEISYGHTDGAQNFAVVDGKKYGLMSSTVVRIGDEYAAVSDLRAGDRVFLWFAGYSAGLENELQTVTQMAVIR